MAVIFTELFEGGADGVALTTSNTNFTDFNGSGSAEFDTDLFVEGGTSGLFLEPRQAHGLVTSGGEFYLSEYVYFHVSSIGNFDFNLALDTDSIQARCQVASDGRFRLVDGSTVVTSTTHVMIPDQWYRVEWTIDASAGTQDLLIFTGANLHSETPTESHVGATYSGSATIDEFTFSRASGAAIDMNIDRIILDDAMMPGPISSGLLLNAQPTAGLPHGQTASFQINFRQDAQLGVGLPYGQVVSFQIGFNQKSQPAVSIPVGQIATFELNSPPPFETHLGVALPFGQMAEFNGIQTFESTGRPLQPFANERPIQPIFAGSP